MTENESNTTFEEWRTNLLSILSLEQAFTPFLQPDSKWGRKTKTSPLRGFHGTDAAQQVATLETMLGLIVNYAPVISRGTVVKSSTSLKSVWNATCLYYGIQCNHDDHLFHSKTPDKQSSKPSHEKYSIRKPPSKPDHDVQYLPENDKTLMRSDPKMHSCAVISSNAFSHDESNLKDVHMNTDAVAMLSEDHENSLRDPSDVISLKCPVPTALPKHPMQWLSSHQKPNLISPQNELSSKSSFLGSVLITPNQDNAHSSPLPSIRPKTNYTISNPVQGDRSDSNPLPTSLLTWEISQYRTDMMKHGSSTQPSQELQQNTSIQVHDLINHVRSLNLAHLVKVPLPSKSTDKPTKSQVTASDNISTEQPPDPNTQVTYDSLLSNTSSLSVSSKEVPSRHPVDFVQDSLTYDIYCHPYKSPLQPGHLPRHLLGDHHSAQYSQQHIVSHVAQISSHELQADCMNTSSTETVCSLNVSAESDTFPDSQDKLPDTVDICTNMNSLEGEVISNITTKQLSEYTQPIQDVQKNLSATVYDHINQPEPLNLTRDTPGQPLLSSRPTKSPVAAIDSSSSEQLVEPCTQATGYLLAQRPNDSFPLNSSCSLVSSLANPHCHLHQSSLQPDRLSGQYPAELHQPVFSPDGHLLSCEGHAYMSAISTDQTARTQDTTGDNYAFSDAADSFPHTMNTGMLVNELEDDVLSNQENDNCLELKPHLPFVTEIEEPDGVVCAPKEFDKMTTETTASEILISDMLNRTVPLHDPSNVTESALKNLTERKPGTSNFVAAFVVKEAPAEATPTEKEHTPLMASYALSSFRTDKALTSSLSRRDGSHLVLTSTVPIDSPSYRHLTVGSLHQRCEVCAKMILDPPVPEHAGFTDILSLLSGPDNELSSIPPSLSSVASGIGLTCVLLTGQ